MNFTGGENVLETIPKQTTNNRQINWHDDESKTQSYDSGTRHVTSMLIISGDLNSKTKRIGGEPERNEFVDEFWAFESLTTTIDSCWSMRMIRRIIWSKILNE